MSSVMDQSKLLEFRAATAGDVSQQQSQRGYREWAERYEETMNSLGRTAHVKLAEYVAELFPVEERKDVNILDVGAGTGLVGVELKRQGFLHIDALEPNEAMINEAKKRQVYEHYINEFLTKKPTTILKDSYNVITGSGIFLDQVHVPFDALYEMVRIVKPGGYVFLTARMPNLKITQNGYRLEEVMAQLEKDGKWEKVERFRVPDYTKRIKEEGVIWKFRVL